MKRACAILFALLLGCLPAVAQENSTDTSRPTVGSPPVGMNFGVGGGSLPARTLGVIVNYRFADNDVWFRNGKEYRPSNPFGGSDQKATANMFALKVRYGLGGGWDIRALLPMAHMKFREERLAPAKSVHGCGDALLIVHKAFMEQQEGAPLSIGADLGLIAPTGSTNRDGLGTGAWGAEAALGATWAFDGGRQLLEGNFLYFYRGKGGNKSLKNYTYRKWGDYFWIDARYVFAATTWLDVGMESQFTHNFQDKDTRAQGSGAKISNMKNAYTTWYVGPAATLKIPSWNSTLGVGLGISAYQHYQQKATGFAPDPNKNYATGGSLGAKWRLEATYSFVF